METFVVRLWVPPEPDKDERVTGPSSLRGLVESMDHHGARPFRGGEQLLSELEAALAERIREKARLSRAHHPVEEGTQGG